MMQMSFVNVSCYIYPLLTVSVYFIPIVAVEVTSSNCTDGDVRLIGGDNEFGGRVEVCINRAWGTVCSRYWGSEEARVVCNQLGATTFGNKTIIMFKFTLIISIGFQYSYGNSLGYSIASDGPILLGYLYCTGNEDNLAECSQNYQSANTYYKCLSHNYDTFLKCTRKLFSRHIIAKIILVSTVARTCKGCYGYM